MKKEKIKINKYNNNQLIYKKMKSFIYFIFFLNLFHLLIAVVPNWDITKIGKNVLDSNNEYIYTYRDNWYEVQLTMTRTIKLESNGTMTKRNVINMWGKDKGNPKEREREVEFDNVGNFYHLNDRYYACPRGKFHLYDYTGGGYVKPEKADKFYDNGKLDFDFRCKYNEESKVLLLFYFRNGEHAIYGIYVGKGTDINQMYYIGKAGSELYDYKLEKNTIGNSEYYMMAINEGSKIRLSGMKATLKSTDYEKSSVTESGETKEFADKKTYTLATFRSEKTAYKNDFFYVTFDDLNNFYSGYTISAAKDYQKFKEDLVVEENKTEAHFEFFDDYQVQEINFMFMNRFVYYILNSTTNNKKKCYGIFDTKLNKVIFNTDEDLVYYIPHSETEMLAVTKDKVYMICALKNSQGTECVDYCNEDNLKNYYNIDTEGNKCISPVCTSGKVTLVPSGVCNATCDTTYYVEKDGLCGLCKFLYPDKKFKLVGGTDCISDVYNKWKKVNEKLSLYECSEGFILKGNECVENITCPENCSKCNQDLACTACKEGFLLEDSKCNENCSKGRGVIDTPGKCDICPDNACEIFAQNKCDCKKCKTEQYFINSSNICSVCDDNCKSCEGEAKKCKSCPVNYKLFNNKCYKCQEQHCEVKESDNCRCNKCKDGYYVDDYECKECNETCKTCSSESICIECQEGYYIQDNKCNSCNISISNCKKCNNSTVCEQCAEHFYKNLSGQCQACPSVCEKTKSDKCQCETCINGYYMDNHENCQKCSDKCQTCEGSKMLINSLIMKVYVKNVIIIAKLVQ